MNLLTLEEEKFKNVKVKGLSFRIRFISPRDKMLISNRRITLSSNKPVDSMTTDEFYLMENIAIVDICTETYPEDFKSSESCINWIDEELITGLANEIRNHTNDIQSRLKKNRPIDGSAEA